MGKPKNKGRKGQTEEFENDSDIELETGSKQDADEKPEVKTKASGKKKKGKKKDDDWDDDVAAEIEALSLEANKDNPDYLKEEVEVQQKTKKKEKKKKKNKDSDEEEDQEDMKEEVILKSGGNKKAAAGFQMLMMDSDGDDNMADSDNESGKEEEEENVKIETVKDQQNKKKKNKGKKEKEANKGEEDIDALLAEIDKPSEKTSKKGKKKKNAADDENNIDQEVDIESKMAQVVSFDDIDDDEYDKKKKKKKGKKGKDEGVDKEEESKDDKEVGEGEGGEDEDSTVKTAAQKRKEKREREKLKKQQEKKKQKGGKTEEKEISETKDTTAAAEGEEGEKPEEDEEKEGKKKKKKGEKEKEKKKKAPVAAIKAHLQKVQEEEERLRKEEEERIRKEEEAIKLREEQKRIEEEKKQKKKQKEKEKKERLRQEGKLLTEKQKQDRKRAQQMLEQMKAQGIELPNKDEVPKDDVPKKRPIYFERKRKNKQQQQNTDETERTPSPLEDVTPTEPETPDEQPAEQPAESIGEETDKVTEETEKEEIKDAWDVESEEEEEEEDTQKEKAMETDEVKKQEKKKEEQEEEESEEEESEEEEDSDEEEEDSEEEESEEESSEDDEELSPIEIARERIMKRKEEADKKRTTDVLRAPVVCVLGHVDTGKTKILDKLRRTHVQDGEAGGITQQIGATNVPHEAIMEQTKMCKEFQKKELKIPGLLIIDTPGHESFSNLRSRGSSLCDIAILVVDIMHGLEPQTIESINLLKSRKTPFIVALNKIDRLYQWKPMPHTDVQNTIKKQSAHTKSEFEERARDAIVQLAEQGLNAALFYDNKNPKEYISLVPTSAHSGDGMGNLIALISELSQTMLAKRISFSEELQATVMEVKALPGLGTTIDVILVNGKLKEGDQMVVPGTEGPIVTQIRGLLMPQPMKEIRVKSQWEHHKEVCAAQGVKIIAKDLEKALAGLPVYIAEKQDEVEYYKEELSVALKEVLGSIKLAERGVFVQASTLGSLEALLEFLRTSKIPYAGINIGPVHKKDIMKASVMLEHDSQYAVILAFDVRVEREAQEMADSVGVRIFTADIIYHLFDSFMAFRDELKKRKQEEFKHIAVFPCKLRVMPQFIFNSRDPIVMGVVVEAGFVKEGTPICIPSKEFIDIGRVVGIENNHKSVDMAKKGQEVCIKIDPIPGEAPKMYGRHFDHTDLLVSKISRQSIDAVKDYFREEMGKADWQLIVELKKMFQII